MISVFYKSKPVILAEVDQGSQVSLQAVDGQGTLGFHGFPISANLVLVYQCLKTAVQRTDVKKVGTQKFNN